MKTLQNFYKQTVSVAWAVGTGNRYVSTKPTPSAGWLVISPNSSILREIVEYTATGTDGTGDFITISARGVGGTTEQTHTVGEPIRMNITAQNWADIYTDPTFTGTVTVPTPAVSTAAATKAYVDSSTTAATPDASTSVKGLTRLSTAPVSASIPIAVGDNDTRVSPVSLASITTDKLNALAGTSGAPSTTNKYVTDADTATSGANKVLRLDGTGKYPALNGSLIQNLSSGFADPMSTRGDIIYRNSSNTTTRLPLGTQNQVLKSNGTDLVYSSDNSIQSFTAAQDFTIGDLVGSSSGIEGFAASAAFTQGVLTTAPFSFSSIHSAPERIDVNKYVLVFTETTTNDKKVVVFTINPNTYVCTFGTPVVFTTLGTSSLNVTKLDTNKFIVSSLNGGTGAVYNRVGTVSGTVISLGTETTMVTLTGAYWNSIIYSANVANEAILITTRTVSNTDAFIEARAITVSGTTPSAGSNNVIETTIAGTPTSYSFQFNTSHKAVVSIGTGKYGFGFLLNNGTSLTKFIKTVAISQSGSGLTIGSVLNINNSSGSPQIFVDSFSTDKFILQENVSGLFETYVISVSTLTCTKGTSVSNQAGSVAMFNNGTSLWFTIGNDGRTYRYTISGTTLISSGEAPFSRISSFISSSFFKDDDGLIISFKFNTTSFYTAFFGQSTNFIGVATNTVSKGGTVNVQVSGQATINQNINSGNTYYVDNGLTVQLTSAPSSSSTFSQWFIVKGSGLNKIII